MIQACIDSVDSRNITGFECGTKADYDARHAGDPLWVFLDYDVIQHRVDTADFLRNPRGYYFDPQGNVQRKYAPELMNLNGRVFVVDSDGFYMTDTDGALITEPA